jgi:hypothetical protein
MVKDRDRKQKKRITEKTKTRRSEIRPNICPGMPSSIQLISLAKIGERVGCAIV